MVGRFSHKMAATKCSLLSVTQSHNRSSGCCCLSNFFENLHSQSEGQSKGQSEALLDKSPTWACPLLKKTLGWHHIKSPHNVTDHQCATWMWNLGFLLPKIGLDVGIDCEQTKAVLVAIKSSRKKENADRKGTKLLKTKQPPKTMCFHNWLFWTK